MILYLDTSSLVKLYVAEDGSPEVRQAVTRANVVATSVVALPEARSAFARLRREGILTEQEHELTRRELARDWASLVKVRVLKRVYERAAELAEEHALRGFDAIHLASFLEIVDREPDEDAGFSAFDGRLSTAAEAEQANRKS